MNQRTSQPTSPTVGDAGTDRHRGDSEVSMRVVTAIADAEGVDPVDLEGRLGDWVDPDALHALVTSMDDGAVTFRMKDHTVRVQADGQVFVEQ